jgi:hypothetical protein
MFYKARLGEVACKAASRLFNKRKTSRFIASFGLVPTIFNNHAVEWALVRTHMYNDHLQRDGRGVFDILITTIRSRFGCGRRPPLELCDDIRACVRKQAKLACVRIDLILTTYSTYKISMIGQRRLLYR